MSAAIRVPPLSERLRFVRNTKTGRVHILPHVCDDGIDVQPVSMAEALMGIAGRTRMLCGAELILGFDTTWPAVRVGGGGFADEDLCIRCVGALGDQSWRAFHADNRGES